MYFQTDNKMGKVIGVIVKIDFYFKNAGRHLKIVFYSSSLILDYFINSQFLWKTFFSVKN